MILLLMLQMASQSAISCTTDPDIATPARTLFEVGLDSGSVEVNTWDRDSIDVVVDKGDAGTFEYRRELRHLAVCKKPTAQGVHAPAVGLRVRVPVDTRVQINGRALEVRISGVSGGAHVVTQAGEVHVSDVSGRVRINSVAGAVTLHNLQDSTDVQTTAGTVTATDGSGGLVLATVAGRLTIRGYTSSTVTAKTAAGAIHLHGPLVPGGIYTLSTDVGEIRVRAEEPLDATIVAGTVRGRWISSLVPVSGTPPRSGARGTLVFGAGRAQLFLTSFVGSIYVE